jgi:transposase
MAIVIGCDMHTRFQQLAVLDTESGVIEELRRENEPLEEVRRLYARWPAPATVAIEATGYARWFSELMAELGHTLVVGDPDLPPSTGPGMRMTVPPFRLVLCGR